MRAEYQRDSANPSASSYPPEICLKSDGIFIHFFRSTCDILDPFTNKTLARINREDSNSNLARISYQFPHQIH